MAASTVVAGSAANPVHAHDGEDHVVETRLGIGVGGILFAGITVAAEVPGVADDVARRAVRKIDRHRQLRAGLAGDRSPGRNHE